MFAPKSSQIRRALLLCMSGALLACTGTDGSTSAPTELAGVRYGKGSSAVSVTSVAPDSGAPATTIDVKVNGNGFADGMVVQWQRGGVPDEMQIRTNSTRWVSSRQLIANITISAAASAGDWDISLRVGGKTGVGSEVAVLPNGFKVTDPTATWKFPLDDAALAIQSDRMYVDGATSVYAPGVCNVSTTIFVASSTSSGDAVLDINNSNGKCARRLRVRYPDGTAQSLPIFGNLRGIASPGLSFPVGATMKRQLHMGVVVSNVSSRCQGLIWGYGVANNIAMGSDSVTVTRLDASTYRVVSQPAPRNLAYCKTTGQLMAMPVDFTVVASRPLP